MVDPDTIAGSVRPSANCIQLFRLPANLRTIVTVYPSDTFRIDWDLLKWHALVTRGMWIRRVCEETYHPLHFHALIASICLPPDVVGSLT